MKYIGYYNNVINKEDRECVPSAVTKMDYIVDTLVKNGEKVEIVSNSGSTSGNYCKSQKLHISQNVSLKLFACIPGRNKIMKVISRCGVHIQLFVYLFLNTKKNEKVIVYHSLGYAKIINFLYRLKKFCLILEVEEIYSDVNESLHRRRNREICYLRKADGYIFSTELLNEEINRERKPYCVVYGTYNCKELLQISDTDDNNEKDKIHVVYAGTFDGDKGGVDIAIEATRFLTKEYHMHILGFGTEKDVERVKHHIADVTKESESTITYDGLLLGEEYEKFIQQCDIGLSTQNPDSAFNVTSFPSKILSYMTNGVRTVSIKIPVLEIASIGPYLFFYEEQKPEKLAQAIKQIDISIPYEGREIIRKLDLDFKKELKCILEV